MPQLRSAGGSSGTARRKSCKGTIAIGDQTSDVNVDGAVRIKSVERLCP
jgi:hypothetical protein